jgi:hypothetical protein
MRLGSGILAAILGVFCLIAGHTADASDNLRGAEKQHSLPERNPSSSLFAKTENGLFGIEIAIKEGGLKVGGNRLEIALQDKDGRGVNGASLRVIPSIYRHGESTLARPVVREKGGGVYNVENVYIEIPGHWVLEVVVKKNGREDKAVFDFPAVK